MSAESLDLNTIRERLQQAGGPKYWRSLESVAETPEFQEFLHREFPSNASEWNDPVGRRSFLKLMSASMALAGVSACTVQPTELIVPYVRQPEEEIPGKPLFFASAMTLGGVATGVLVESHEGRPTKVEGNPDHPGSLGATDLFAQASVLTLYDPDRSQSIVQLGEIRPWATFVTAMKSALQGQAASKGAGLRILTETVSSPTMAAQLRQVLAAYPEAKWIQWEALPRDHARAGARLAFGEVVEPQYDFTKADVIVSLDADFLASDGPANLRATRQFSSRRRVEGTGETLNRLYVVEGVPSVTGGKSDHRVRLKSSQIDGFARALAARVGVSGVSGAAPPGTDAAIDAIAKDLAAHRGRSIVLAGDAQPPSAHALAHAMNEALGNAGQTVTYTATPEAVPSEQLADLRALVTDMDAGRVQLLLLIGEANPVLTAPADLKFADALAKVPMRAHSGLFLDETATLCHWHVPGTHYLEAWSDARTIDGTASIVQPLIQPMYGGKSAHEVLATLSDAPDRAGYDIVREFWMGQPQGSTDPAAFEKAWRGWLHDGLIPGTAHATRSVTLAGSLASALPTPPTMTGMEVNFRRDATVYDGRFVNNGWLQEMPKPMTKLTWDNAALVAPDTALQLDVENGDVIEVRHDGRLLRVPVWIAPGHAADSVTISVGYGRTRAGRLGNGTGFNAYALRGSSAPYFGAAEAAATGDDYRLVSTQDHWTLEDRNIVRSAHLEEFKANPTFAHAMEHMSLDKGITLLPEYRVQGLRVGHGDRHERLHRLRRVRRRLRGGEQHPGRRQGTGLAEPRDALAARRSLLLRQPREPGRLLPADALPALRERALRGGVPGGGDHAQRRRPERHGLQPLRRHPLLLEQLPVQGAALQLPPLPGLEHAAVQAAAQPGRDGAQPRHHGEVHLLRAAHQRGAHPVQARGARSARRRDPDGVPGSLPGRGHRVRQHQRSEQQGGEAEGQPAQLLGAGRPQHAAPHHLSRGGPQPQPGSRAALEPRRGWASPDG